MMKKCRYIIGLLLLLGSNNLFSQSSIPAAQAVFVYNFTRLIEWPANFKSGDFNIGVIGSTEVFNELKSYTNGKMVASQPIKVVKYNDMSEISKCHILFVAYSKTKDIADIVAKISDGTLIVSENRSAIEKGASINFVILEDKLKFELKISNASKMGLKVHSNLENMAMKKY